MLKNELSTLEYQVDFPIARFYLYQMKGKNCEGISSRKWADKCCIFTYQDKLWSFPDGWSHMCNSISMCGPPPRSQRGVGGAQSGAAKNHICLDKNRSMPRNQIQKQRKYPTKSFNTRTTLRETQRQLLYSPLPAQRWTWRDSVTSLGRMWI